ncbi:MAG: pentapeptide repeat-containing protein [Candidatus Caenarcaniphilales bacterium]|nr:pentapeptide repeat-containing protein [Candidatus Caenarcaniphilales bacterium]
MIIRTISNRKNILKPGKIHQASNVLQSQVLVSKLSDKPSVDKTHLLNLKHLQKNQRRDSQTQAKLIFPQNISTQERQDILQGLRKNKGLLSELNVVKVIASHASNPESSWKMAGLDKTTLKILSSKKLTPEQKISKIQNKLGNLHLVGETFASNLQVSESILILGCKDGQTEGCLFTKQKDGTILAKSIDEAKRSNNADELAGQVKLGKEEFDVDFSSIDFTTNAQKFAELKKLLSQRKRVDLEEVTFAGLDLSNMDFRQTFLGGANLTNTNLANANFEKVSMYETVLTSANLTNANFQGASLAEAEFSQGWIPQIAKDENGNPDLRKTFLFGVDLSTENMTNVNLAGADLADAILPPGWVQLVAKDENRNPNLRGVNFNGVDLREEDLTGVNLEGSTLGDPDGNDPTKLPEDPNWIQTIAKDENGNPNLQRVNFSYADLSYLNFAGANIAGATFDNATLKKGWVKEIAVDEHGNPNLSNVSLVEVDLRGEDLSGANLKNANLFGADLTNTNLTNSNLEGIRNADLRTAAKEGNDYSEVDPSCLTPERFDHLIKESITDISQIDSIPFISKESKQFLQKVVEEIRSEGIQTEDKSGISLIIECLSRPKNLPLLLNLLSQTRDVDKAIRKDAIAILKPASPYELKIIADVIGQELAKENVDALQAFQFFSQHFSDLGSPLAEDFRGEFPIIKKYLSASQKLLLSELLKGNNKEVQARKFNGAEYCFLNPQFRMFLDLYLQENNKNGNLGTFLKTAHQIFFFNKILQKDLTADLLKAKPELWDSLSNPTLAPPTTGDYLQLIPTSMEGDVKQALKTKHEKIEYLKEVLDALSIDYSEIRPKANLNWYQQELLSTLEEKQSYLKEEVLKDIYREINMGILASDSDLSSEEAENRNIKS